MAAPFILNEERHDSNFSLVHDSLAQTGHVHFTYNADGTTASVVIWTNGSMVNKLRETLFTYSGGSVATVVKKVYDQNTYSLLQTMTGTFTYNADGTVQSIAWVRS